MSQAKVIKLRLSLMGRPIKTYTFDLPVITVGRDPSADISLENPGVSREHFRLERLADETYQVVDLGSANGTQVNDRNVNVAPLRENDVIRFGKYTLWVSYDQDRRNTGERQAGAQVPQDTVVLSRDELTQVVASQRKKEVEAPPSAPASSPASAGGPAPAAAPAPSREPASPAFAIVLAFMGGAAFGLAAMWLALSR